MHGLCSADDAGPAVLAEAAARDEGRTAAATATHRQGAAAGRAEEGVAFGPWAAAGTADATVLQATHAVSDHRLHGVGGRGGA